MDFIERLFAISPDGGTGSLELLILLVAGIVLARVWRARTSDRRRSAGMMATTTRSRRARQ